MGFLESTPATRSPEKLLSRIRSQIRPKPLTPDVTELEMVIALNDYLYKKILKHTRARIPETQYETFRQHMDFSNRTLEDLHNVLQQDNLRNRCSRHLYRLLNAQQAD